MGRIGCIICVTGCEKFFISTVSAREQSTVFIN